MRDSGIDPMATKEERTCFVYPGIDTKYAPGYSEKAFDQISRGMIANEVERRLGPPFAKNGTREGFTEWVYTSDGKCSWGDFAWLRRAVTVSNNVVVSIDKSIRYD